MSSLIEAGVEEKDTADLEPQQEERIFENPKKGRGRPRKIPQISMKPSTSTTPDCSRIRKDSSSAGENVSNNSPQGQAQEAPPGQKQRNAPPQYYAESLTERMDRYCWHCHYEDSNYECKTCQRFFHTNCIHKLEGYPQATISKAAGDSDAMILERCQECMVSNDTTLERFKPLTSIQLEMLLTAFCKRWVGWLNKQINKPKHKERRWAIILNARNFGPYNYEEMCGYLVKVMDMQLLQDAVASGEIRTMEGFAAEMKFMYHNSVIFNGRLDSDTKLIYEFIDAAFKDLNEMNSKCIECQLWMSTNQKDRRPDSFMDPCAIPHPVIWAKMVSYPYWPAKIISLNANDDLVEVAFFQDHTTYKVKLENCVVYSNVLAVHSSDRKRKQVKHGKTSANMKLAMEEATKYIDAMAENEKFGKQVVMNDAKTPVTPDFIRTLFPKVDPAVLEIILHPSSSIFKLTSILI